VVNRQRINVGENGRMNCGLQFEQEVLREETLLLQTLFLNAGDGTLSSAWSTDVLSFRRISDLIGFPNWNGSRFDFCN